MLTKNSQLDQVLSKEESESEQERVNFKGEFLSGPEEDLVSRQDQDNVHPKEEFEIISEVDQDNVHFKEESVSQQNKGDSEEETVETDMLKLNVNFGTVKVQHA